MKKYIKSNFQATEDYANTSELSFDFIVTYNYSQGTRSKVERIVNTALEKNGCGVYGFTLEEADYSDSPKYREFEIFRANVAFEEWGGSYDENKIEKTITEMMRDAGYKVIGGVQFYLDPFES
jgi:hypothetical protein